MDSELSNIYAGGFAGVANNQYGPLDITRSFATGSVTAAAGVGGFIGVKESGNLHDVYFDQDSTGQENCYNTIPTDTYIPGNENCTAISDAPTYFKDYRNMPFGDGVILFWDHWDFNGTDLPTLCHGGMTPCLYIEPSSNEVAVPDRNGDGIDDIDQDYVLPISVRGESWVTVVIPEDSGCVLNKTDGAEGGNWIDADYFKIDANFTQQSPEMVKFTIECQDEGQTVPVTLFYDRLYDTSKSVVRFYNDQTQTYDTIPGATFGSHTVNGGPVTTASYSVTDGGKFDIDGTVDGVIHDPVGLSIPATAASNASGPLGTTGQTIAWFTLPALVIFIASASLTCQVLKQKK
jgi:hypothetical protein